MKLSIITGLALATFSISTGYCAPAIPHHATTHPSLNNLWAVNQEGAMNPAGNKLCNKLYKQYKGTPTSITYTKDREAKMPIYVYATIKSTSMNLYATGLMHKHNYLSDQAYTPHDDTTQINILRIGFSAKLKLPNNSIPKPAQAFVLLPGNQTYNCVLSSSTTYPISAKI